MDGRTRRRGMKSAREHRRYYEKIVKKHVQEPWSEILLDNRNPGYPHSRILANYLHHKISFHLVFGFIEIAETLANDYDEFFENNINRWTYLDLVTEAIKERDHWLWIYNETSNLFEKQIKNLSTKNSYIKRLNEHGQ